ncbi:MAG TPA: carboxypeptidase regulatory-like domain-containing protein [Candidatus Acidoferrales bacterium]|nr:carboxypeptidase regulatory-like domain-containing protein [Candidatus Acidoferrales bacterium]
MTKLPVRRVVLYKSGVGYFEHLGQVRGDQTVAIDFTSAQLNDVLQSLTVLDLNGGRITGVDYNSQASLSQRLGALRLPLGEKTNLAEFLAALRGSRVEIRSGDTVITGRLLSVEPKTRVNSGTTMEVDLATVVSDTGEVRSVEITPAANVRLAEKDVTEEVGRYLSLLASERQRDLRRMTIATAGTGDRRLYVSYISEVPIWKTTYRVVLPAKPGDEPLLQGWAIVDNTVGEDWNDVELSLVAGAPQSFIQQLSQPYYARRPVVPLPQTVQLSPQTHESAMLGEAGRLSGVVTDSTGAVIPGVQVKIFDSNGGLVGTTTADSQGRYSFGDLPAANYRLEFSALGFQTTVIQGLSVGGGGGQTQNATLQVGGVSTTVTVNAQALRSPSVGSGRELGLKGGAGYGVAGGVMGEIVGGAPGLAPMPAEGLLTQARLQTEAAAQGANLGDLFEYKLKDRVTIHKNESALVPIVNVHVAAEKVSLWNSSLNSPRPLRALWLTNSSPLTLDGGSFTVLENEAFAGEGLTEPIKPDEKRLLSYAADLGVRVDAKAESQPQRVTRVRIYRGVMTQTRELRQNTTYTVRDDDTTPRTILIEHPLRTGWKLAEGGPKPAETTSNLYRFRMNVEPKATAKFEVNESEPLETRYEISNFTDGQITLFLQQKSINPQVETALRKIVEQKDRVAALEDEISRRDDEKQKIYDDQQRLRENLKALKGSPEERALTQRYTQQLADQETRLQALAKESADFQAKHDAAQDELDKMIQELSLDATL